MDYEDYYYQSRNRYYNACSEVTYYENRVNELRDLMLASRLRTLRTTHTALKRWIIFTLAIPGCG